MRDRESMAVTEAVVLRTTEAFLCADRGFLPYAEHTLSLSLLKDMDS